MLDVWNLETRKTVLCDRPRPHVVMIAEPANHMSNIHKESVVAYAHQTVSPQGWTLSTTHDQRTREQK